MKNHQRPAGSMEEDDRISQLPGPILDHVISFLPQNDAVRTCLLSRSWRYLGPTRPKIEFVESSCRVSKEKFLSVVDNTLKRYDDQKLAIQEFVLWMSVLAPPSVSLLKKWIPKVVKNVGLKTFFLRAHDFSLPSVVFEAQFLTELILAGCKLDQINNNIKLQMLKRLDLFRVHIDNETFEKIISSCPSIEHLAPEFCYGLSNVKVNKARNLKQLDCCFLQKYSIEINDDAPSLETISIKGGCLIWYHHKNNNFFPRLKSLCLWSVHLPAELFNNISSENCPCLEELKLHNCSGFTEFELSNCSIKRLIFVVEPTCPIKAAIDAANMLYFEYKSCNLPTFSFSTTSRECKSQIVVCRDSKDDDLSTWSLKLHEFLKSLRQSQISLDISYLLHSTDEDSYDGGSCEPVVVEHLCLKELYLSSKIRVVLNCLFHICRPRYIGLPFYGHSQQIRNLAKSIWTTLTNKGEPKIWHQDLEESSIQVSDEHANEWRPVQVCEFSNDEEMRFMLKWREYS